jgi:hypothetical protein
MGEVARGRSEVQGRRKWPLCFRAATRVPASAGCELAQSGLSSTVNEIPHRARGINPIVLRAPRFHISVRLAFASTCPYESPPPENSRPPIPRSPRTECFVLAFAICVCFVFFLSFFLSFFLPFVRFLLSRSVQPGRLFFSLLEFCPWRESSLARRIECGLCEPDEMTSEMARVQP